MFREEFMNRMDINKIFYLVYDDEGDPPAGDPPAGDPPAGDPPAGDPPAGDPPASGQKSFTQEDVNRIMKKEKDKNNEILSKSIDEYEALKAKAKLTGEERVELDENIEKLRNQLLTKGQLAEKEKAKLQSKHKKELTEMTTDRDTWQKLYTTSTIERSIIDSAHGQEAWEPEQIVAILSPNTRLMEEVDGEGAPLGNLVPMVKFSDTDKDGKPVTLELSVKDSVKRMKEMKKYFNLFKSEGTGGLGSMSRGGSKIPDAAALAKGSPEAYRKAKKDGKLDLNKLK